MIFVLSQTPDIQGYIALRQWYQCIQLQIFLFQWKPQILASQKRIPNNQPDLECCFHNLNGCCQLSIVSLSYIHLRIRRIVFSLSWYCNNAVTITLMFFQGCSVLFFQVYIHVICMKINWHNQRFSSLLVLLSKIFIINIIPMKQYIIIGCHLDNDFCGIMIYSYSFSLIKKFSQELKFH